MTLAAEIAATAFDATPRPFFAEAHAALRRRMAAPGAGTTPADVAIDRLVAGAPLDDAQAGALFDALVGGSLPDAEVGAVLLLLRPERLAARTIAVFVRRMRDLAVPVRVELRAGEVLADTCGTGSDGFGTFNVSTAIVFVLAAAGMRIAKHGNRGITSRCGSADVLEALGARVDLDAAGVETCLREVGVGFMLAPRFHGALATVQRVRRALAAETPPGIGSRTVFNALGPLANPARVPRQLVGVYAAELVRPLADVLGHVGLERALVAFGTCDGREGGIDELSTAGPTRLAELRGGAVVESMLAPEDVGVARAADAALFAGGDAAANAEILRAVLSGADRGPRADLVLLNAAAGLYLGDRAASICEGVGLARRIVASGDAVRALDAFVACSRRVGLDR